MKLNYSNKNNVNILTALLVSYGINHVVVCPGSRNAPLVHNFSECPDIECHLVTDERSAAFVALGMRQMLHKPVAVCVTSGSALLNTLPAVAEASYQKQGIIVISADRPQQWIGQLDGQTLPQNGVLERFVRKSVTLPEPNNDEEMWWCNRLVCEALMEATSSSCASVHINVPITEPLFDFTEKKLPELRKVSLKDWDESGRYELLSEYNAAECPMVVIGQIEKGMSTDCLNILSQKTIVLYEPLSFSGASQCFTDQMMYAMGDDREAFHSDFVIYLGGNTVSKRMRHFLRSYPKSSKFIMVNEEGSLEDVSMHASVVLRAKPNDVLSFLAAETDGKNESPCFKRWSALRKHVAAQHDSYTPEYSSMMAVKLFEQQVEEKAIVHYSNSTPVRLAAIYANEYRYCNRGLNGIEGSISTAAGASIALQGDANAPKCYCVTGDLSFFYDSNAMWQHLDGNFRILLLNNSQGGIFRQLKGLEKSPVRDSLISAQHSLKAKGLCTQFGATYLCATDEQSLRKELHSFITMDSNVPVVLEVLTDMDADERAFRNYYQSLCCNVVDR